MSSITIPDFATIQQSVQDSFTKSLGSDINFDPSSPTGQLVDLLAADYNSLYQVLQTAFDASRGAYASGKRLDDLAALLNIKRGNGDKTICKDCTLTGMNNTVIPAGSKVKTTTGIIFYTIEDATISGNTVGVDCISEDYGAFTVEAGQLTVIVDTLAGWTSVNNPTVAVVGQLEQNDGDLRKDLLMRSQNLAFGYGASILAVLEGINGVKNVYAYVNYTNTVSGSPWSSPANSIWIIIDYIDRTLDPTIASTILSRIPPITTHNASGKGTQVTENVALGAETVAINWNIAVKTPVNFEVIIENQTSFTQQDETDMKNAIINYMEDQMEIYSTLYYSKLYSLVVATIPTSIVEGFRMVLDPGVPSPTDIINISPNFWEILTTGTITFSYGS